MLLKKYSLINLFIAAVWLANGLLCKVLNLVPRHQEIVKEILSTEYAGLLTILIGIAEVVMTVWILSNYKPKWNAVIQIVIIAVMNIIEFTMVPHLLLWGRLNIVFAAMFIALIYFNEFHLNKKQLA